jgi:two-component system, cell cycle sensor histidine kinase and response regulator CckA
MQTMRGKQRRVKGNQALTLVGVQAIDADLRQPAVPDLRFDMTVSAEAHDGRVSAETRDTSSLVPPQTERRHSSLRLRNQSNCREDTNPASAALALGDERSRVQYEMEACRIELKLQNAELRRAKMELEESRDRYFELYHCAPVGYCTIDEQGQILESNRCVADLLGVSLAELQHRPLAQFILPEDREIFYLQRRHVFATMGIESFELRMRRNDNEELAVWLVLSAIFKDATGQSTIARVTISDVTLRKKMERDQRSLQTQLFRAQKAETVGILAGAIAHDFNNLLAGIMADVVLLEIERPNHEPGLEYLDDIKTLAQRGADLTKQLLGLARRDKSEVAPLDLDAVVEGVCKTFERTHRDIRMGLHRGPGTRFVLADRGQLEQVVLNLLVNAQQAMPGGGDLQVVSEEVLVSACDAESHGVQPGRYARLNIIDSGVGMSEAVRARIFEPFFTTRQSGAGSGLGLTSVYGIVKNHGGFITVESTLGHGAAFFVYLPSTTRQPVARPVSGKEIPRNGVETLLLVDDEEHIVKSWGRTLRHLGYRVFVARNGIEAIDVMRQRAAEISLVILDLIMPGMGGSETFDRLRQLSPHLKVLLWSGYGSDGVATEMMARGCNGFIQKPSGVAAVSAKLRELLDPSAMTDSIHQN